MPSESAFSYAVSSALFIPREGNRMDLVVRGRGFVDRAIPLAAKVGAQAVAGIQLHGDGSTFSGLLARAPEPGDRLLVGYWDEPLRPTSVVYRAPERPVA